MGVFRLIEEVNRVSEPGTEQLDDMVALVLGQSVLSLVHGLIVIELDLIPWTVLILLQLWMGNLETLPITSKYQPAKNSNSALLNSAACERLKPCGAPLITCN